MLLFLALVFPMVIPYAQTAVITRRVNNKTNPALQEMAVTLVSQAFILNR